jgi:hypothetical protein
VKIDDYSFGNIVIGGRSYSKDVIIYADRVFSPWWRQDGHLLQRADLDESALSGYREIIIGTGYYGVMKVPDEMVRHLESIGLSVTVMKTTDAVKRYNDSDEKAAVAALHLTC